MYISSIRRAQASLATTPLLNCKVSTPPLAKIRSFSREQKKQNANSTETLKQIRDLINNQYDRYHIALDDANEDPSTVYEPQIVVSESFI